MTFNAHVTTDADHHLTAGSTVVVHDEHGVQVASAPVPALAEFGGVMFWPRIGAALAAIGWHATSIRPGGGDPGFDKSEAGIVRFNAAPKES